MCDTCGRERLISFVLEHLRGSRSFGSVWVTKHFCSRACVGRFLIEGKWEKKGV